MFIARLFASELACAFLHKSTDIVNLLMIGLSLVKIGIIIIRGFCSLQKRGEYIRQYEHLSIGCRGFIALWPIALTLIAVVATHGEGSPYRRKSIISRVMRRYMVQPQYILSTAR